jgi:hypothetical protein
MLQSIEQVLRPALTDRKNPKQSSSCPALDKEIAMLLVAGTARAG